MRDFNDDLTTRMSAERRAARHVNNNNPMHVRYQARELAREPLSEPERDAMIGAAYVFRRKRDGMRAAMRPVVAMERVFPHAAYMPPDPPPTHRHVLTVPYRLVRYGQVDTDPEESEIRVYRLLSAIQADEHRLRTLGVQVEGKAKRIADPIPEPGESVLLDYGTSDDAFRAMTAWRSSRAPRFGWLISLSREPGASVVRVTRAI